MMGNAWRGREGRGAGGGELKKGGGHGSTHGPVIG